MYKATTEATHFLPRTGSHSTKGSRTGRVDVLPPEAKSPIYDDLQSRRTILIEKVKAAQRELTDAKVMGQQIQDIYRDFSVRVKYRKDRGGGYIERPAELVEFERRKRLAREKVNDLQSELSDLNGVMQKDPSAKHLAFAEIFLEVAKVFLDTETFGRLMAEAKKRRGLQSASTSSGEADGR